MLKILFPGITQEQFADAFTVLEECKSTPALGFPYPFMGPGGQYGNCWWERDTALTLLGYRWLDRGYCRIALDNFTFVQKENGRIPLYGYDRVLDFDEELSAIPVIYEVAAYVCRETADEDYVRRIYGMLARYMDWWLSPLKRDPKTGLVCGIFEEADPSDIHEQLTVAQPDLNVQVAVGADVLAEMATRLGDTAAADRYRSLFAELRDAINRWLYNPADGGYYAWLVDEERLLTEQVYNSMFDVFKRGIVPLDRRRGLLKLLKDDSLFGYDSKWGITTMAKTCSRYVETVGVYQGYPSWSGNIWTFRNRIIATGLLEAGLREEAAHIALQTVRTFNGNYAEFISPSTGEGHGVLRYGWSASEYIHLIVEVLFGIRYDAVTDTVTVTPCMPRELDGETVSIGNLSVGDKYLHVTIKCGEEQEVAYRLTSSEE